jgi:CheY-like chemotaxis protein
MIESDALNLRSSEKRSKTPFTILVVEDNPTDIELMLHTLEQADIKPLGGDFEMEVRANAEGALQLLGERSVDLVLTDLMLPPSSRPQSAGPRRLESQCGGTGRRCDPSRRL